MKKFSIITLGCKVNQYESDAVSQQLEDLGWRPADLKDSPDACIVNTCTVTRKSSMQSRQAIRRIIRNHPQARIIVTGCYAQTEPDQVRQIPGVDAVIGHSDKHRIAEILSNGISNNSGQILRQNLDGEKKYRQHPVVFGNRTRPFLKIQDGCNSFCTYCIVPYARGRSRSMPPEAVLAHIRALNDAGYREIVLTGIHLGCYGLDLDPRLDLEHLLSRIAESPIRCRVRLGSLEASELSEKIIRQVAESDTFCPHFHVPLQSGDDGILKCMHRPYTRSFFADRIRMIHQFIPYAGIGVDILAGFPGESLAAFENTCRLIEDLPLTYLHVFPFSARQGTPAAGYEGRISQDVIADRCRMVREIGARKKWTFYRSLEGKTEQVLIEGKRKKTSGKLKGLTGNYVPVLLSGDDSLRNALASVRIEKAAAEFVSGAMICRAPF